MSEIQKFFEQHNLLVTGGTGFFGKILVEKLLRGLPGIGKIYLLVRPKRGKNVQDRMDKYFDLELFDTLKKRDPDVKKKVIPVDGDITKPRLGISDQDYKNIIDEVSIVYHAAGTTKFNDPLQKAVQINVNSILEVIKLCRELKKLKAAVYLSTAFIRCNLSTIDEVVYPLPMTYEDVNNSVDILKLLNFSKENEEQFTKLLLGDFPNTYLFTKSIAEGIINEKARDLPFCIVRFPVATSTYKEPITGWVDTVQGINQVMMGLGRGVAHTMIWPDKNDTFHMVPSDFACNAIIASTWETARATKKELDAELPVYNYVNGKENRFIKANVEKFFYTSLPNYFPTEALYYPFRYTAQSRKVFAILDFLFHMLPTLIGDLILRISGKKPFLYKIYKKGTTLYKNGEFFLVESWSYNNKKIESLWKKLSEVDKQIFYFDMAGLDWDSVLIEHWKGILKYIMKDDLSLEGRRKALARFYRLRSIHRVVQTIFLAFLTWIIWKLFCGRTF